MPRPATAPRSSGAFRRASRQRGLVVLLHGLASNMSRWAEFAAATRLARHWSVARADLRGHGESLHRGRIGFEAWCGDLEALLAVRLAQLAALVARLSGELTDLAAAPDVPALRRLLQAEPTPYWTTHYRFDHATPPRPKRLGAATVDQLIINAVEPLLFVLGRAPGDQALRDRAIALLEQLPPEHNTVLAQWTERGVQVDSAARGQALLELQHQYSNPRRCLSCGFGRHLLRGTRP